MDSTIFITIFLFLEGVSINIITSFIAMTLYTLWFTKYCVTVTNEVSIVCTTNSSNSFDKQLNFVSLAPPYLS